MSSGCFTHLVQEAGELAWGERGGRNQHLSVREEATHHPLTTKGEQGKLHNYSSWHNIIHFLTLLHQRFLICFLSVYLQVHLTSEPLVDEGRRSQGNHGYHTRAAMEETSRQSAEAADDDESTSEVVRAPWMSRCWKFNAIPKQCDKHSWDSHNAFSNILKCLIVTLILFMFTAKANNNHHRVLSSQLWKMFNAFACLSLFYTTNECVFRLRWKSGKSMVIPQRRRRKMKRRSPGQMTTVVQGRAYITHWVIYLRRYEFLGTKQQQQQRQKSNRNRNIYCKESNLSFLCVWFQRLF